MASFNGLITLVLLGLLEQGALSELNEDSWENDAQAYEQDHALSFSAMQLDYGSICPKCADHVGDDNAAVVDNSVALIYYKKFIANLFQRKKLQYDESSAVYQRALIFTIQPAQLEKLEQLTDPRDLDSVLTEIFAGVRTPYRFDGATVDSGNGPGVLALVWDILKDLAQLLKTSEVQFVLIVATAIIAGWFVNRRYRIGMITLILGGFLAFGYFVTYLECNRKLEVEQMMHVLAKNEQKMVSHQRAWYAPLLSLFRSDSEVVMTQHETLIKSSKLNLAYCRPDHVLMLYCNDIFLTQLEFLLEKCIATISTLQKKLTFPYNIVAAALLLAMIAYIVKLTFKYILSPGAWAALWHRPRYYSQPHPEHTYISSAPAASLQEDRISGENLKLLLTAISGPSNNAAIQNGEANGTSGVQMVRDQLEAAPPLSDSKTSSANSSTHEEFANSSTHEGSANSNEAILSAGIDGKQVRDIVEQDLLAKSA